jgi:hypothetical protein
MANVLPPCKLIELDLSGVEAVILGWYAARLTNDPTVIRFAKLGLHALVASHLLRKPPDMGWPDPQIADYFQAIKKAHPDEYDTCKRTVHGTGYGMTPEGMVLMFPDVYESLSHAQKIQRVYFDACPPVPAFQLDVKTRAAKKNRLGGPVEPGKTILTDTNAHVFGYDHEFFNVVEYRKLSAGQVRALKLQRSTISVPVVDINGVPHAAKWGPDSKRALAFYPQSTNAGGLNEIEVELFDEPDGATYIGDFFYGRTPLRAPIHDSLFMECPFRKVDRLLERAFTAMLRPYEEMPMKPEWGMGAFLTVGVEGKIGDDWAHMTKIPTPTLEALGLSNVIGVAGDGTYFPADDAEDEDVIELRTAVA